MQAPFICLCILVPFFIPLFYDPATIEYEEPASEIEKKQKSSLSVTQAEPPANPDEKQPDEFVHSNVTKFLYVLSLSTLNFFLLYVVPRSNSCSC